MVLALVPLCAFISIDPWRVHLFTLAPKTLEEVLRTIIAVCAAAFYSVCRSCPIMPIFIALSDDLSKFWPCHSYRVGPTMFTYALRAVLSSLASTHQSHPPRRTHFSPTLSSPHPNNQILNVIPNISTRYSLRASLSIALFALTGLDHKAAYIGNSFSAYIKLSLLLRGIFTTDVYPNSYKIASWSKS